MSDNEIITKEFFDGLDNESKLWCLYNLITNIDRRMENIEKWVKIRVTVCATLGGVIGGAAAILGKSITSYFGM